MTRIAIIGAGRMGSFHARLLHERSSLEVAAIVDVRTEIGKELASEIGASYATSVDQLEAVDGWIVATSTHTHGEVIRTALDRRTPMLSEKPLTLDLAESVDLAERAADTGVPLQVGFWRRYAPPWARIRTAITSGEIGSPTIMRFAQWDATPPPAEFCDPAVSGGLAIDCGVHEFDLAEWFTDQRVVEVTAIEGPSISEAVRASGDVDNMVISLRLSEGTVATVDLSRNSGYGDDVRTEVVGTHGVAMAELLPASRVRIGTATGLVADTAAASDDAMTDGVIAQAEAFARLIAGENVDVPMADASIRAVMIGRAAQESMRTGGPVTIDP